MSEEITHWKAEDIRLCSECPECRISEWNVFYIYDLYLLSAPSAITHPVLCPVSRNISCPYLGWLLDLSEKDKTRPPSPAWQSRAPSRSPRPRAWWASVSPWKHDKSLFQLSWVILPAVPRCHRDQSLQHRAGQLTTIIEELRRG